MKTLIELPESKLTKHQIKTYGPKFYKEGGTNYRITATVRYDDQCDNGHNSFGITAEIYRKSEFGKVWQEDSFGCCHDQIAKHFPELAPLIKWHLTSSDGPMHYVGNTVYMASDKDFNGRRKGERYQVKGCEEKRVVFGDFPITFEFKDRFTDFIEKQKDWSQVKPCAVEHPKDEKSNYKFDPKWTITGHGCEWYQCPFDREEEAQEFIDACRLFSPKITVFQEKFTRIGAGKERELDAARSAAVWPDATDAELTDDGLESRLIERLPTLMAEFKQAVKSLGFTY